MGSGLLHESDVALAISPIPTIALISMKGFHLILVQQVGCMARDGLLVVVDASIDRCWSAEWSKSGAGKVGARVCIEGVLGGGIGELTNVR